jgi:SAM-dependent methyltransferase
MRRLGHEAALDLRAGGWLGGTQPSRYAHLGALGTQSTPYAALQAIFRAIPVGPRDVLVDVGCGKGRVIHWWLLQGWTNPIVGLEIDPAVAAATRWRFRNRSSVAIITGDAVANLPAEGTIFFLHNPFVRAVVQRFRDALVGLRHDRGAVIAYHNCHHADLFADACWEIEDLPPLAGLYGPQVVIRLRGAGPDGSSTALGRTRET